MGNRIAVRNPSSKSASVFSPLGNLDKHLLSLVFDFLTWKTGVIIYVPAQLKAPTRTVKKN